MLLMLPVVSALPGSAPPAAGEFVRVPGGSFRMGGGADAPAYEQPVHEVRVSSFWLARHEVQFAQYDAFCRATGRPRPSDRGWGRGRRPVIHVSWYDALAYCNWRSREAGRTPCYDLSDTADGHVRCDWSAGGYRLPTEAEWEYAARGGAKARPSLFAGSKKAAEVGWYHDPDRPMGTQPVGRLQPNELGLHDLSGNVWEWCWDAYGEHYYHYAPAQDPRGPDAQPGQKRVVRGGSWFSPVRALRCATRAAERPDWRSSNLGFRLARNAE